MNRKSTAVILSGLVCPGAGQIYNRQPFKGLLLIAAALVIISVAVYKTWTTALRLITSMPLDEAFTDLSGLAHKVMEADRGFYNRSGAVFLAIWLYGMVDAYLKAENNPSPRA